MNILKFNQFLLERMALKDELPKHHINAIKDIYGKSSKKFLDMDVPSKTENIKEGKWVLSKEEKDYIIKLIFDDIDVSNVINGFKYCTTHLTKQFMTAFNASKIDKSISFNLPNNAIDITVMLEKFYGNNFYAINVKETKSTEKILRDSNGVPITKDGKIQKVSKNRDEIIFSKNKTSFTTFVDMYNDVFENEDIPNPLDDYEVNEFYSRAKEILDMDMFKNFNMELYITSKPSDILNMSISRFYDSCQNLYNGEYNRQLLSNVFDNNMKVAYLIFNTPFTDKESNVNPITSVSRCIIRNVKGKLFFDQIYPYLDNHFSKLQKTFFGIITKYTGMKSDYTGGAYYYSIPDELDNPYLDSLTGIKIVNDDRTKALLSLYNFNLEDIECIHPYLFSVHQPKKNRNFYIIKKSQDDAKNDFIENCIEGAFTFIKKPIANKTEITSMLSNILNYFDFKKFAKVDGIKGNEAVVKRKVNEIIRDYYENNILDFIKENKDCLIISKMVADNHPYFLIFYTKDGKCHNTGEYNIYEIE